MSTKREEYTAKMKLQLDEMNSKINALETQAHEARVDALEKYHAEVTKLRHQSNEAMAKLNELKVAGEDSWDKMVHETEKIRDALVKSFHYFKSQV